MTLGADCNKLWIFQGFNTNQFYEYFLLKPILLSVANARVIRKNEKKIETF